ncbi:MAG: NTP transferase domain-containing protein, partial [Victivallales bacterium]|nr:NTP transferase domain-containing protein [Victivallales bacterium]
MAKAPCTIILAAGKGTRMHSETTPKVCFPVNGIPAIVRAMRSYAATGVQQFVVVVGTLAEQVMKTVGAEFPNCVYAFQPEQNGTAGAVACAMAGATMLADDDDVLIVAGDRLIDQEVLEQFLSRHNSSGASLSLMAQVVNGPSGAGRIVQDDAGAPLADIELADIRQRKAYLAMQKLLAAGETTRGALFGTLCENFFPGAEANPKKGVKAFGKLWESLSTGVPAEVPSAEECAWVADGASQFRFATSAGERTFSPSEAETTTLRNTSVYLVKAGLLRQALPTFTRENAQQEIYLPDLVNYVYRVGLQDTTVRTTVFEVTEAGKLLGFNNPSELLEVEKALHQSESPARAPHPEGLFRPLSEWLECFAEGTKRGTAFRRQLEALYGADDVVIDRQLAEMTRLGEAAEKLYPLDAKLMFVRAPGRLNTMGRHVDHQGGNCNLMTISFETMMFVAERMDDTVTMRHIQPELFPADSFRIGDLLADLPWEDWEALVGSEKLVKRHQAQGITWSDYIRAAVLRLQKKYHNIPLQGMDLLVTGNIPMAAGLSSSSSLVVCASEAVVRLNGLSTAKNQLITLCGESEWFVGTHGGSADHAAVKLGECGTITKVRFFDFGVEGTVSFPPDYQMVVCDSGIKARKSSNAKDQFNHRVACYRLGFALIRRFCPQYAAVLHHLRDVNTQNLRTSLREIYKILLRLPENPSRAELEEMFQDVDTTPFFSGHDSAPERRYPVRGVVLYGLSEMARSAKFAGALARGDIAAIGEMMMRSHDGDRVVAHDEMLREIPYVPHVGNHDIMQLMEDIESGEIERVERAQLERQSGAYGCSIPAIDLMVDIASRVPGVAGAQLAGAGLGGCMMIFTHRDAIPDLTATLMRDYYEKFDRPARILPCRPVSGAGALVI